MTHNRLPIIIQGGMGAGVSGWRLARAVSEAGQLGVVSGTALDAILARRLQVGDVGGHMRRALDRFPIPGVAQRIVDRYFVAGARSYKAVDVIDYLLRDMNEPLRGDPVASAAP